MSRKSARSIVRAVLVLLCASNASRLPAAVSGVNRWSPIGPAGASVARFAIDPKSPLTVYAAGGPAGLYRSTDGGATWSRLVIDATADPSIGDVAVDPSNSSVVLVAGAEGGFFKSTDRGATWAAAGAGLAPPFLPIVISASQPTTIYAGRYRSTDRGETFSAIALPVDPSQGFVGIAVDSKSASTIFAVFVGGRVPNGGVFKSTDAGVTWTDTRVPTARPGYLTIDPVNSAVIYAADLFFPGTFKSLDVGATWASLPIGGQARAPVVVDPASPSSLYALVLQPDLQNLRLVRSTDGGASWLPLPDSPPQATPNSLVIDPTGLRLYLANSDGGFVRRTEDRPLSLLNGRFQVALDARDPRTGRVTAGVAITQGDRWGYFSLPEFTGDAAFPEVVVKMADATALLALGGTFWFFHSSLTDVEYALTVTDTVTGTTRTFRNVSSAAGQLCGAVDTSAFPP